jgi:hypothetical protein
VAIIAAVESSRRYSAARERILLEKIEEIKIELASLALKTNTLWEIYCEEVLRSARNAGMIASQSKEAPTDEWTTLVSEPLELEIEHHALEASRVLNSPYDVFVEVWQIHKKDLLTVSRTKDVPLSVLTAGVLQICRNAIDSRTH